MTPRLSWQCQRKSARGEDGWSVTSSDEKFLSLFQRFVRGDSPDGDVRYPLSLHQVEDLLHERGIDICHETVRFWRNRFGPMLAAELRRRRVHHRSYSLWRWHLDEVFVRINGETQYLWRAVDHEGEVLQVFATKRRDRKAALRFLRKSMKRYGRPDVLATERLRSYRAAMKIIGNAERQETGRWINNRAENSHRSTHRFTTISAKCVISAAVKTSKSIVPLPWQSGVNLPPEIYRSRGSAPQLVFF